MRIGVDLGGTKIEFAAFSDNDRLIARNRVPTPAGDYEATIEAIRAGVVALEQKTGLRGSVGVGIPGSVSPATGKIRNANSTCLNGNPLDRDLEKALERPVRLANDANCFTLSEATDGAGRGFGAVFGVILGTGVGGGLVIDGKLLAGRNLVAGEWGHNHLPWQTPTDTMGRPCYCGLADCLETHLSGPALSGAYTELTGATVGAEDVAHLAENGNTAAREALGLHTHKLARALAQVINILDPDVIILGGGLSNIGHFYDAVPELWKTWVFSDVVETRLLPPKHGDASGVRGAAWLWPGKG